MVGGTAGLIVLREQTRSCTVLFKATVLSSNCKTSIPLSSYKNRRRKKIHSQFGNQSEAWTQGDTVSFDT